MSVLISRTLSWTESVLPKAGFNFLHVKGAACRGLSSFRKVFVKNTYFAFSCVHGSVYLRRRTVKERRVKTNTKGKYSWTNLEWLVHRKTKFCGAFTLFFSTGWHISSRMLFLPVLSNISLCDFNYLETNTQLFVSSLPFFSKNFKWSRWSSTFPSDPKHLQYYMQTTML